MQTSYNILMATNIAGQIADLRTAVVESPVADTTIAFGMPLCLGVAANSVKLAASTGDVVRGIAAQQHNEQSYPFTTPSGTYAANDVVNNVRRGLIYVQTAKAVAADAPAYIDVAGGSFKATDTSSSNLAIPTGVFRETTAAAGTALLEINMP